MTEAEWLACEDTKPMLEFFQGRMSERKLRLFAVACVHRVWERLSDPRSRHAIELAERSADEPVDREVLAKASDEADKVYAENLFKADDAQLDALNAASCISSPGNDYWGQLRLILDGICRASSEAAAKERAAQTTRLRDIFGNPFRPVPSDPSWLTSTVTAIARGMYESRDFTPMPILADALQDAGCDNDDILNHCRGDGPHVRGCWVVDLVLGKA